MGPTIGVGDVIPDGNVAYVDDSNQIHHVSIHSLAAGKKVILVGVPGAFTPGCSMRHVPGFIEKAEELKSKGIDDIICISVNDPFVMRAWAKTYPENKHVKFFGDGTANYTCILGLDFDISASGVGTVRSRRYAILIDDLTVKIANIEVDGNISNSTAEEMLKNL